MISIPHREPETNSSAPTRSGEAQPAKGNLVLLRHGQSTWNKTNRFTGWTDVPLSAQGVEEAFHAARLLQERGFRFDVAFTSVLTRAIATLWIVLEEMGLAWIPVRKTWRLNERHYGALQGLNKHRVAAQYGERQVHRWRRSYGLRPPAISFDDNRHPRLDPRYADLLPDLLPRTESLKDTEARMQPCWIEEIKPRIRAGQTVLIAAHGNSLRALIKHIEQLSDSEITHREIPTGIPLVYDLDPARPPLQGRYLTRQRVEQHEQEPVGKSGAAGRCQSTFT